MIHGIHILQLGALEWIHLLPICISLLPDSDNYLFTVRRAAGWEGQGGRGGGWGGGQGGRRREMVEDD